MSKKPVNTKRSDKLLTTGGWEEIRQEENRRFFLQVIDDFDRRVEKRLDNLRTRLNESWEEDESRASSPPSQEYLEEIKRLSAINEDLEKRQRSLEQKVKKVKKPPHARMLHCVSKGFRKLKKPAEEIAGKSTENSPDETNHFKTEPNSVYYRKTSSPSLLQWSPARPPVFSVPETDETGYQHTDAYGVGVAAGGGPGSPRGQDLKKGHGLVDRFDLRKVRMPSADPCQGPSQAPGQDAEGRDALRIFSQSPPQHKLLGGSEIPYPWEELMSRFAADTDEASWETQKREFPEDPVTSAKLCRMNHIEAKGLEMELREIDNKMEPRKPTAAFQSKEFHTKKFKRKVKK